MEGGGGFIRKTLYLVGGMEEETKLRRIHKAVHDSRFRKINIVGQHFEEPTTTKPTSSRRNSNDGSSVNQQHHPPNSSSSNSNSQYQQQHIESFDDTTVSNSYSDFSEITQDGYYDDDDVEEYEIDDGNEAFTITDLLSDLLQFDGRRWKSVKLIGCNGRVDLAVKSILSSNVNRFVLAEPEIMTTTPTNNTEQRHLENTEDGNTANSSTRTTSYYSRVFAEIGQRLPTNRSLSMLQFQNVSLTKDHIRLLCQGLKKNRTLLELNFHKTRFLPHAVTELAKGLAAASTATNTTKKVTTTTSSTSSSCRRRYYQQLHHLSFQHCKLSDNEVADIVKGLVDGNHSSLHELCLDGNQCGISSFSALAKLLTSEGNQLLVLDLASQVRVSQTNDSLFHGIAEQEGEQQLFPQSTQNLSLELSAEFCNALAINSRLTCLQLSDTSWSVNSMVLLANALRTNKSLRILHLAWCDMSSEIAMSALADALTQNTTLYKLVLYETRVTLSGISSFARKLQEMKGLRSLDLGGNQQFDGHLGVQCLLEGLGEGSNVDLEELLLRRSVARSTPALSRKLGFYTDVNRAGRRFLQWNYKNLKNLSSLWPLILERAQTMDLPAMYDPWWLESGNEQSDTADGDWNVNVTLAPATGDNAVTQQHGNQDCSCCDCDCPGREDVTESRRDVSRRASVLFYLLRNGVLLQQY